MRNCDGEDKRVEEVEEQEKEREEEEEQVLVGELEEVLEEFQSSLIFCLCTPGLVAAPSC